MRWVDTPAAKALERYTDKTGQPYTADEQDIGLFMWNAAHETLAAENERLRKLLKQWQQIRFGLFCEALKTSTRQLADDTDAAVYEQEGE